MGNESVYLLVLVLIGPLLTVALLRRFERWPVPLSYNLRSIRMRWQVTLLTIGGISVVVTVFLLLLSMLQGFQSALRSTGTDDNALILQRGSPAELTSALTREQVHLLSQSVQVALGLNGQPLASPERVLMASLPRRGDGSPISISFRGVRPTAFSVRTGVTVSQGRNFTQGQYEVIVGQRLLSRVADLALNSKVRIAQHDWHVVGIMEAAGGAFESEIWGDVELLGSVYHREENYQSLTVRLTNRGALAALREEVAHNPQTQVLVQSERQYYEDLAGPTAKSLKALAILVALVMGLGAVFAAMNTMYGLIAARVREIGTLRALGFSGRSVLYSFLLESMGIALCGGALGCLLVLPINGLSTGTGQTSSFSEVVFAFRLTPPILLTGIGLAVFLGALGGLMPARRAARMPLTAALRSSG